MHPAKYMGEILNTLNDLISTCRDSEEGFGKAAKGVHSDNLRNRFTGIARQRSDFADELARYVKKIGVDPPASGHQSAIQHRGWRELEESIRPKDDASFLAECQQGEENTLRHYEHALSKDLPAPLRPIIERQRLAVQEALLELRGVEFLRRAG
jgi:uncharacterized protein (TIGR02284 family)